MENETTVMKALITAFIIGLISVTAICLGDFYHEVQEYDRVNADTVEVPVVDANIYDFN